MVQTLTRALKMNVTDTNEKDWDEYAERMTFAINTAYDRVRRDTTFYPIQSWDPRSRLESTLPLGSTKRQVREPRRWWYHIKRPYQRARKVINDRLRIAIQGRADRLNTEEGSHEIEVVSQVWIYLYWVKEGYAWNLAYMWHGPFRVIELEEDTGCGWRFRVLSIAYPHWYVYSSLNEWWSFWIGQNNSWVLRRQIAYILTKPCCHKTAGNAHYVKMNSKSRR